MDQGALLNHEAMAQVEFSEPCISFLRTQVNDPQSNPREIAALQSLDTHLGSENLGGPEGKDPGIERYVRLFQANNRRLLRKTSICLTGDHGNSGSGELRENGRSFLDRNSADTTARVFSNLIPNDNNFSTQYLTSLLNLYSQILLPLNNDAEYANFGSCANPFFTALDTAPSDGNVVTEHSCTMPSNSFNHLSFCDGQEKVQSPSFFVAADDRSDEVSGADKASPEQVAQDVRSRKYSQLQSEKRRREQFGSALTTLRDSVPSCRNSPGVKLSKTRVVRRAIEYIHYLLKQRVALWNEIMQLRMSLQSHGITMRQVAAIKDLRTRSNAVSDFDSEQAESSTLPKSTLILVFLGLFDSLYEDFMARLSTSNPEELYVVLSNYIQDLVSTGSISKIMHSALSNMAANFSPSTDGAACRLEKWLEAVTGCTIVGYSQSASDTVRTILAKIAGQVQR